jgi:hypothetical protein
MRSLALALSAVLLLAGAAGAQSIHPPTREGFGAKPDQPGSPQPDANRPEAEGGANSKLNRDYGKETQPEGNKLHEDQKAPNPQTKQ